MRELIAEHKPYIDKMNKTGPQLLELSPVAGVAIREKYTATDQLYAQLKADVKQRAFTLDEAISKSTQVTHVHFLYLVDVSLVYTARNPVKIKHVFCKRDLDMPSTS